MVKWLFENEPDQNWNNADSLFQNKIKYNKIKV